MHLGFLTPPPEPGPGRSVVLAARWVCDWWRQRGLSWGSEVRTTEVHSLWQGRRLGTSASRWVGSPGSIERGDESGI